MFLFQAYVFLLVVVNVFITNHRIEFYSLGLQIEILVTAEFQ